MLIEIPIEALKDELARIISAEEAAYKACDSGNDKYSLIKEVWLRLYHRRKEIEPFMKGLEPFITEPDTTQQATPKV